MLFEFEKVGGSKSTRSYFLPSFSAVLSQRTQSAFTKRYFMASEMSMPLSLKFSCVQSR